MNRDQAVSLPGAYIVPGDEIKDSTGSHEVSEQESLQINEQHANDTYSVLPK